MFLRTDKSSLAKEYQKYNNKIDILPPKYLLQKEKESYEKSIGNFSIMFVWNAVIRFVFLCKYSFGK